MLTIICLFFLGTGFYAGYRRGLTLQLIYFVGYALTFWVAQQYYKTLGQKLSLLIPYPAPTQATTLALFDNSLIFDMDKAFYSGIGFILILIAGWLITRFIGMLSYGLTFIPIIKQGNSLLGGLLNLLVTLVGLVVVLTLLAMIPVPFIQQLIDKSILGKWLIEKTPILSHSLYEWWVTKTIF